jgi:hypothetical protein
MELAISLFLGGEGLVVTAPTLAPLFNSKKPENRRPWCYLVSQLSEEGLNRILIQKFISNQHASLHVMPFSPPPSHYIGRIKNLTLDANLHQSVVKLIQKSINEDSTTINFIAVHHDLIPTPVIKHGSAVNWIINSIKAFHIQSDGLIGKPYSQWKWYIFTPTRSQEFVDKWTKTLASITFDAEIFGVGETVTSHKCTRCKSTNHANTECPFTNLSQFINPLPAKRPTNTTRGGRGGRRGNNRNARDRS